MIHVNGGMERDIQVAGLARLAREGTVIVDEQVGSAGQNEAGG